MTSIASKCSPEALFKYASDEASSLVQPMLTRAAAHMQPLCNYGILGKLPMLPFSLCISRDVAWSLHVALCSLSGPISNKRPPLRLSVQFLKPPKFASWSSLVAADSPLQQHAARHLQAGPDSYIVGGFACASSSSMPTAFELACPKCHHGINAISRNLFVPIVRVHA